MIQIDLITGFLGSGKTTFLREYARYYMEQGLRVGILENDYGAINVDMLLLQDLRGDNCELEMIAGGCDLDCHKRRFKTKLISMAMSGYNRVLVEPSGIFDVDEFFDLIYDEPLDNWYQIGNVIAIVNAQLEKNLTKESEYLLVAQIAKAGKVVLSKTQFADSDTIGETVEYLNKLMGQYNCNRRFEDVCDKPWQELTVDDYKELSECGYKNVDHIKLPVLEENSYSSLYFLELGISPEQLEIKAKELLKNKEFGTIFRVKGFAQDSNQGWIQINATANNMLQEPIKAGQDVVIVIGEDLNQEKIDKYLKDY